MKVFREISYTNSDLNEQKLDIYIPENDTFDVLIYFHGGGLQSGDKSDMEQIVPFFLEKNMAVVSANYRLYPNAKYPEFIYDAAAAVSWTVKNINKYGKCKRIFVCGSSAGAYLSMMLCFDKKYLASYGVDSSAITAYIHNSGQPTCHFNVLKERGIDIRRIIVDEAAPLYHIGNRNDYPYMLFIVSDNDMPNRYEQTLLTVSTLKHFGFEKKVKLKVMHGKHCQHDFALDENSESIFGKIIFDFVNEIE